MKLIIITDNEKLVNAIVDELEVKKMVVFEVKSYVDVVDVLYEVTNGTNDVVVVNTRNAPVKVVGELKSALRQLGIRFYEPDIREEEIETVRKEDEMNLDVINYD